MFNVGKYKIFFSKIYMIITNGCWMVTMYQIACFIYTLDILIRYI